MTEAEMGKLLEGLCVSKVEEFHMLGYEHVEAAEIWTCVCDKYKKDGLPALHQVANDILSLKTTQFMNWNTMNMYKGIV